MISIPPAKLLISLHQSGVTKISKPVAHITPTSQSGRCREEVQGNDTATCMPRNLVRWRFKLRQGMPSWVANFRSREANTNRNGRGEWLGEQIARLWGQTELPAGQLSSYDAANNEFEKENENDLKFAPRRN